MTWTFHPLDAFPSHEQTWRDLNERGPRTPLLDPRFVRPLIDEFTDGDEVLGICERGSETKAMAVFKKAGRFAWQTLQPANAPLGLWVCDGDLPFLQAAGDALRSLPGFCALLGVSQQDPDLLARPADSASLTTMDYIDTARMSVSGTFDAYWDSRGKNLRHNIKRQTNRLQRDGVVTRVEMLTAPADMDRAVDDYSRLEVTGWKGRENTAVGADDAQGRFYKTMLKNFAETGESIVYRYYYDDLLAASDLCLCVDGTLIILKTAYDESVQGTSPAQLMRYEAFRPLYDEARIQRIEFYGPVKDWHRRWTDEVRTMYHVNLYRWPIVKRLHGSTPPADH